MTTLYVTEQYSIIKKEGDTLVIQIPADEKTGRTAHKVTVPLIKITQLVIIGDSTLTTLALSALLDQNTEIVFISMFGQFRGRIVPSESRNSILRLAQFRAHEQGEIRFKLARQFVIGKINNGRTFLMRANRKHDDDEIKKVIESMRRITEQIEKLEYNDQLISDISKPQAGTTIGSLEGLEGAASAQYFSVFGKVLSSNNGLSFDKRTRRPPRDPVNALLSYGYTLLLHQCCAALQIVGFDIYFGYLHSSQYNKPALGLDLMEEFRVPIVDSVIVTLINNRIITENDFVYEMESYRLKDNSRRTFLEKFEERLNTEIIHPLFNYKATYRRCIELQARLLAKVLQEEIESYTPFKIR